MPGLPKEMLKKREAIKAAHPELVAQEQQQHVLIPLDPPTEKPANETPPVVVEEPEEAPMALEKQWELKSKQWEDKYRSLQGVVETLEPTVRSEKEIRLKLEREIQELREAMPKPEEKPDPSEELTEEELAVYGSSAPVIEKVARKIARGELKSALTALTDLRKEISELREANTRVQTDLSQTSEQQFIAHVASVIKNFDAITTSKEWSEYLGKKVPYSRGTIYQSLQAAHEARDLDTIKEIFDGFKPSKSALDAMRSPTLNGGAAPISTNGSQKPILKWSDRKKISDDFRMGRIKKEEKDKWDKLFKEAEAEGRVDMNK